MLNPEILDTFQAAEFLGLSASTMAKLRCAGNGPAFYKVGVSGKRVLYRRADLETWLLAQRRTSTSDTGHAAA